MTTNMVLFIFLIQLFCSGENMNHIPHASICIFINKQNELLMIKRSESLKTYPGVWAFPGGKIDKGEDAVEAAIREAEEEVSLSFDRYNCNYIWSDIKPNGKEICFFVITEFFELLSISENFDEIYSINYEVIDKLGISMVLI
jgi:8-oxo-dGTP pyrophosphatase MutT (NUDIX family)